MTPSSPTGTSPPDPLFFLFPLLIGTTSAPALPPPSLPNSLPLALTITLLICGMFRCLIKLFPPLSTETLWSVLFLPSGGLIATAGGNSVKIWDVIGEGRLLHAMESHNKTVTSLCLGRAGTDSSRILSVSIDGYLKVFDYAEFRVTHTVRHPAQLLSVGFSPSGLSRVVGASNGILYVGKKNKKAKEEDLPEVEKRVLRPSYYMYFHRGQSEKPSVADHVIKKSKRVKLVEHDKLLKKFSHGDALLSALNTNRTNNIVAVLEELVARKKLVRCIENLDANGLGFMLGFLHRNTTKSRYGRF